MEKQEEVAVPTQGQTAEQTSWGDVVFLYPDVGALKVNMGRALFVDEPVYRQAIMDCDAIASPLLPSSLLDVLYPSESSLEIALSVINTACFAQPCLFAICYALTKVFVSRRIYPTAVMGHSIGEYAAAVAARVMDMPTAMKLVCERGRLMMQLPAIGAMVSVGAASSVCENAIQAFRSAASPDHHAFSRIAIAAVNGPAATVISGDWFALDKVIAKLPAGTVTKKTKALYGDHSPINEAIHAGMRAKAKELFDESPPLPPAVSMVSTVKGVGAGDDIASPDYWVNHTTSPIFLTRSVAAFMDPGSRRDTAILAPTRGGHHHRVFVEMGPGTILQMIRGIVGEEELNLRGFTLQGCLSTDDQVDDMAALERCVVVVRQEMTLHTTSGSLMNNSHTLVHGWVSAPILLESVANVLPHLARKAMTVCELAKAGKMKEGPLAIALRTLSILGYLRFECSSGNYSTVPGWQLDELESVLAKDAPVCNALWSIYAGAAPPFKLPSEHASRCMEVWKQYRGTWQMLRSQHLSAMLDGVVLTPLVVSLTYNMRWDERGVEIATTHETRRFDLTQVKPPELEVLKDIIQVVLRVGEINDDGVCVATAEGAHALKEWRSHYTTVSFAPMLNNFPYMLRDGCSGSHAHDVQEGLAAVGNDLSADSYVAEIVNRIRASYIDAKNNPCEPEFIVCAGCGCSKVAIDIYGHLHTRLNKSLTIVAIAADEESRLKLKTNLKKDNVPHITFVGDLGDPPSIIAKLQQNNVDLKKTLHVQTLADSACNYIPIAGKLSDDGAVAALLRAQVPELMYHDALGNPIGASQAFASLLQHWENWADALEGSPGVCRLDCMALSSQDTRRFMDSYPLFHHDMLYWLAGHHIVPASAYALAASMAGVMPTRARDILSYPLQARFCCKMLGLLVKRPFKIRLAELSDLPRLVDMEVSVWGKNLSAQPDLLKKRLTTTPTTNFVCTVDDCVIAVVYAQRIADISVVGIQKYCDAADHHTPTGVVLQIVAIAAAMASVEDSFTQQSFIIPEELLEFVLHYARLDPTIDKVVTVTRTKGFKDAHMGMEEYVALHTKGDQSDPILSFHQKMGGAIQRVVPEYRPEDVDNQGFGILVLYDLRNMSTTDPPAQRAVSRELSKSRVASPNRRCGSSGGSLSSKNILVQTIQDYGHTFDESNPDRAFWEYGITSAQLEQIRETLEARLAVRLPSTVVFDYPSVPTLVAYLDSMPTPQARRNESRSPGRTRQISDPFQLSVANVTEGEFSRQVSVESTAYSQVSLESPAYSFRAWGQGVEPGTATPLRISSMSIEDLLEIQKEYKKIFSRPHFQRFFTECSTSTYPDRGAYLEKIQPKCEKAQGKVLNTYGYVEGCHPQTVHRALIACNDLMIKYWRKSKELQKRTKDLVRLTRPDVLWPGSDDPTGVARYEDAQSPLAGARSSGGTFFSTRSGIPCQASGDPPPRSGGFSRQRSKSGDSGLSTPKSGGFSPPATYGPSVEVGGYSIPEVFARQRTC